MALRPKDIVIGAVVYGVKSEAPLPKGKIAGPENAKGQVVVGWENGFLNYVDTRSLLTEMLGINEIKRLMEEKDRLEKEFLSVQLQCEEKMEKAAVLIREAGDLAKSVKKLVPDIVDSAQPWGEFEKTMEYAGWRTSSWHC